MTANPLLLNDLGYFEAEAVNVLVFSSWYNANFSDSKISGIELIHHGERTATNGDVRLNPTPEQWDPIPSFGERRVLPGENAVEADLSYPEHGFRYTIRVEGADTGVRVSVRLADPLPQPLRGKAALHLEFLPSAYFEKTYQMGGRSGIFPLYPSSGMRVMPDGAVEARPLATGRTIVLAPGDPQRRVRITSGENEMELLDGRHKAQNGWFVLRTPLPANRTGTVVEWLVEPQQSPGWRREPVIAYSQVGYHPQQDKVATIELDGEEEWPERACLEQILPDGTSRMVHEQAVAKWGRFTRYHYRTFDFSTVRESGLYRIRYGERESTPFPIREDVYAQAWHPTLDIFFPVQMDHLLVNEAYRVWHGAAHLDDARQAPVNHVHFDLYAQGPTTDTPYEPGEHIPGLNIGGWFDAGDFDIRTQTHYAVIHHLVNAWERFRPLRDQTTVDRERRFVDLHRPDGIPDLLQQIEQGTLALIAQHRAVGHAIPGIIVPEISQYTHLGDALTMTDNLVYDPSFGPEESDGFRSGKPDDRWAFTSRSSALNHGSIAALAAASRVLRGYRDELAEECLQTAVRAWREEQGREPDLFRHGNTTGGDLEDEQLKAAVELFLTTGEVVYREAIESLWPAIENGFVENAPFAVRALPRMDEAFRLRLEKRTRDWKKEIESLHGENPFGVPISTGGWAGGGLVVAFGIANEYLHRAFPEIIGAEDVYRSLHYIFGRHPDHNLSLVSGVGVQSKKVAYGMNRADFSFIAGGVVPGILILPPDFPENKEDWPYLWGENEYVINVAASYLYLAMAAQDLLERKHGVRRVALVFDDGPFPEQAGDLLPLLEEAGVRVTFAQVASRVLDHPQTTLAARDAGHEIVNHSFEHRHPGELSERELVREIAGAQKALTEVLGSPPAWYWPPYLEIDDRVRGVVNRAGFAPYSPRKVVSSEDWNRSVGAGQILTNATTGVEDGSVILFHEWREETIEQLPAILNELRRQGCQFMTFSELQAAVSSRSN